MWKFGRSLTGDNEEQEEGLLGEESGGLCSLSTTQRIYGFAACFVAGLVCMFLTERDECQNVTMKFCISHILTGSLGKKEFGSTMTTKVFSHGPTMPFVLLKNKFSKRPFRSRSVLMVSLRVFFSLPLSVVIGQSYICLTVLTGFIIDLLILPNHRRQDSIIFSSAGVTPTLSSMIVFVKPIKFAVLFTFGNLLAVGSTAFLLGPIQQMQMMFDPVRAFATAIYLGCVVIALVCALWIHSKVLTIIAIVIEIGALIWYSLSYIPFARRMVSELMIRLCDTEL